MKISQDKAGERKEPIGVRQLAGAVFDSYSLLRNNLYPENEKKSATNPTGYRLGQNFFIDNNCGKGSHRDLYGVPLVEKFEPYITFTAVAHRALLKEGNLNYVRISRRQHGSIWRDAKNATNDITDQSIDSTINGLRRRFGLGHQGLESLISNADKAKKALDVNSDESGIDLKELIALYLMTQIVRHPETYKNPSRNGGLDYTSAMSLIRNGWQLVSEGHISGHVIIPVPYFFGITETVTISLLGGRIVGVGEGIDKASIDVASGIIGEDTDLDKYAPFIQTVHDFSDHVSPLRGAIDLWDDIIEKTSPETRLRRSPLPNALKILTLLGDSYKKEENRPAVLNALSSLENYSRRNPWYDTSYSLTLDYPDLVQQPDAIFLASSFSIALPLSNVLPSHPQPLVLQHAIDMARDIRSGGTTIDYFNTVAALFGLNAPVNKNSTSSSYSSLLSVEFPFFTRQENWELKLRPRIAELYVSLLEGVHEEKIFGPKARFHKLWNYICERGHIEDEIKLKYSELFKDSHPRTELWFLIATNEIARIGGTIEEGISIPEFSMMLNLYNFVTLNLVEGTTKRLKRDFAKGLESLRGITLKVIDIFHECTNAERENLVREIGEAVRRIWIAQNEMEVRTEMNILLLERICAERYPGVPLLSKTIYAMLFASLSIESKASINNFLSWCKNYKDTTPPPKEVENKLAIPEKEGRSLRAFARALYDLLIMLWKRLT